MKIEMALLCLLQNRGGTCLPVPPAPTSMFIGYWIGFNLRLVPYISNHLLQAPFMSLMSHKSATTCQMASNKVANFKSKPILCNWDLGLCSCYIAAVDLRYNFLELLVFQIHSN